MKGEEHTKSELLVTDDERIAKLHSLLGSRFSKHGQLLLPTFTQYETLPSDEGLQALAKELCRWLGYKPRSLTVKYGPTNVSTYSIVNSDEITVNQIFRDHPLVTGGILATAVIRFVLEHHHYIADDRFIEVSTIETGLGLWMINAFQPRLTKREKFYHMLDGNWMQLEGYQLRATSAGEYIRQFTIFASNNRHFPEDYGRGITKRGVHLLPPTPSTTKIIPLPEPTATIKHIQDANKLWIKILLLSASAAAVIIFALLLLTPKSSPIPYEQTRDTQALRVIKDSLDQCIQQASDQQSTYDPNDLFMTRQIDATKTRCESLRNQYNDTLSLYEINYLRK
jgi:hypothetical protein